MYQSTKLIGFKFVQASSKKSLKDQYEDVIMLNYTSSNSKCRWSQSIINPMKSWGWSHGEWYAREINYEINYEQLEP